MTDYFKDQIVFLSTKRQQMTILVSDLGTLGSVCAETDLLLVATLNPATMDALQLFRGDTIIVRSVTSSVLCAK